MGRCSPAKTTRRLKHRRSIAHAEVKPNTKGRRGTAYDFGAESWAIIASLVECCKLNGVNPEAYFTDIFRVMPYWSRDRYLELTPKYWARTRARLAPAELARPLGHICVPPPLPPEEQPSPR